VHDVAVIRVSAKISGRILQNAREKSLVEVSDGIVDFSLEAGAPR
jgi:hypothetical protein